MSSLGGQTVPSPATQAVRQGFRGATFKLADGTVKHDLVNANTKKIFQLTWRAITAAQLSAINTGYETLTSSGTWTDHNSTSTTVIQDESLPPLEWEEINAADGPRYNVSLTLRQV